MRLIVYTAMIGETDEVQAPDVVDSDARYLCFSDRPCVAPYEWIPVPTADDGTPPSRLYKVLADHPRLQSADAVVWHDASYRLTGSLEWVRTSLQSSDLVAMRHQRRNRIEDEGHAIARYGYVTTSDAERLVAEYRAAGFLQDRITSAGLFGRRVSARVRTFNSLWWTEIQRWRYRDQVSLDYAAHLAHLTVRHVAGTVRDNPYALWRTRREVLA